MNFKVSSELLIKNASDMSGVLVFCCFSARAMYFHSNFFAVLKKINESSDLKESEIDSWLQEFSLEDKKNFLNTLIDNSVLLPSEQY